MLCLLLPLLHTFLSSFSKLQGLRTAACLHHSPHHGGRRGWQCQGCSFLLHLTGHSWPPSSQVPSSQVRLSLLALSQPLVIESSIVVGNIPLSQVWSLACRTQLPCDSGGTMHASVLQQLGHLDCAADNPPWNCVTYESALDCAVG